MNYSYKLECFAILRQLGNMPCEMHLLNIVVKTETIISAINISARLTKDLKDFESEVFLVKSNLHIEVRVSKHFPEVNTNIVTEHC